MAAAYVHQSIMVAEVRTALVPRAGGRYVDGTLGGGGHALALLEASGPDGWLYGIDRDSSAIVAASERLAAFTGRFELRQGNFAGMAEWIQPASCDGVLLDLGVSSPQLDHSERGFSFQADGPLDMRMDTSQGPTAADLVNGLSERELSELFGSLGDEPQARRIARVIVQRRQGSEFRTTGQLAGLIETICPRRGQKKHPATRVFQALRMAVNDEVRSLRHGLAAASSVLRTGGRLAVITFHSIEDRIVKSFGREAVRDYTFMGEVDVPELRQPRAPQARWVFRKLLPSDEEVAANPRARSAKLRVLERL